MNTAALCLIVSIACVGFVGAAPDVERDEAMQEAGVIDPDAVVDVADVPSSPGEGLIDATASLRVTPSSWRMAWRGEAGPLAMRARRPGDGPSIGGLSLGAGPASCVAGDMRLDHGLGLLALGAGRWRRLGADGALLPARSGLGPYGGADGRGAIRGGGAVLRFGGAELIAVSGVVDPERWREPLRALRLSFGADVAASALWVERGDRGSVSAAATVVEGAGVVALEGVLDGIRSDRRAAAAMRARRQGKRWLVEGAAAAGATPRGGVGAGLPLAEGDEGIGGALRAVVRLDAGMRLAALCQAGSGELEDGGYASRRRVEVTLSGTGAALRRWRLRVRRDREERHGWSTTRPWEPAATERDEERWSLGLRGEGGWRSWRVVADVAGLARQRDGVRTDRALARLRAERDLGAAGRLRLSRTVVWGGPLDMTTLDAPAPGIVAVRHARHLRTVTTAGWAGRILGVATAIAVEAVTRDDVGDGVAILGLRASAVRRY